MCENDTYCLNHALLDVDQARAADAEAEKCGIESFDLMMAAGRALATAVMELCPEGPVTVLCGPGNNGGDGFVAARFLAQSGRDLHLALLGSPEDLTGDAARAADQWSGAVLDHAAIGEKLSTAAVVVDALFGAGLSRPVAGDVARLLLQVADLAIPVVAADMPSGLDGDTGLERGTICPATLTVTFGCAKPGHYLLPGRLHCGRLVVADIGIPKSALDAVNPRQWLNHPDLWRDMLPFPGPFDHKYGRGFLVIFGGSEMSGAARFAAQAARRSGLGLVRLAVPSAALSLCALDPGVLTFPLDTPDQRRSLLAEKRHTGYLLGPGNGLNNQVHDHVLAALKTGQPCVLDADALTVFSDSPSDLFAAIQASCPACIMTPHEGEFSRLFINHSDTQDGKLSRVRRAAQQAGAVIVLKGSDTVIAAPDGRAVINDNAPPWLATGGSGDVLAGLIGGLLAQSMPPFEAACAGVWIHGAAASYHGIGMIAEDIPPSISVVLRDLLASRQFSASSSALS